MVAVVAVVAVEALAALPLIEILQVPLAFVPVVLGAPIVLYETVIALEPLNPVPEADPAPPLLNVTELVTDPALVAVDALPDKEAVIVPALKLPEASRATMALAVFALVAVVAELGMEVEAVIAPVPFPYT